MVTVAVIDGIDHTSDIIRINVQCLQNAGDCSDKARYMTFSYVLKLIGPKSGNNQRHVEQ